MAAWKVTVGICVVICISASAIKEEDGGKVSETEDSDQHGARILKSLVKRWGEDMFGGCHCSWHVGCSSDSYCYHLHGHEYSCRPTCCGVECTHHGHASSTYLKVVALKN